MPCMERCYTDRERFPYCVPHGLIVLPFTNAQHCHFSSAINSLHTLPLSSLHRRLLTMGHLSLPISHLGTLPPAPRAISFTHYCPTLTPLLPHLHGRRVPCLDFPTSQALILFAGRQPGLHATLSRARHFLSRLLLDYHLDSHAVLLGCANHRFFGRNLFCHLWWETTCGQQEVLPFCIFFIVPLHLGFACLLPRPTSRTTFYHSTRTTTVPTTATTHALA